jgi:hypothetical protein
LAAASNQQFYELTKEFNIDKEPIPTKYKRSAVKWYKKQLKYKAFGQICPESRPVKYKSSGGNGGNGSIDDGFDRAAVNVTNLANDISRSFKGLFK